MASPDADSRTASVGKKRSAPSSVDTPREVIDLDNSSGDEALHTSTKRQKLNVEHKKPKEQTNTGVSWNPGVQSGLRTSFGKQPASRKGSATASSSEITTPKGDDPDGTESDIKAAEATVPNAKERRLPLPADELPNVVSEDRRFTSVGKLRANLPEILTGGHPTPFKGVDCRLFLSSFLAANMNTSFLHRLNHETTQKAFKAYVNLYYKNVAAERKEALLATAGSKGFRKSCKKAIIDAKQSLQQSETNGNYDGRGQSASQSSGIGSFLPGDRKPFKGELSSVTIPDTPHSLDRATALSADHFHFSFLPDFLSRNAEQISAIKAKPSCVAKAYLSYVTPARKKAKVEDLRLKLKSTISGDTALGAISDALLLINTVQMKALTQKFAAKQVLKPISPSRTFTMDNISVALMLPGPYQDVGLATSSSVAFFRKRVVPDFLEKNIGSMAAIGNDIGVLKNAWLYLLETDYNQADAANQEELSQAQSLITRMCEVHPRVLEFCRQSLEAAKSGRSNSLPTTDIPTVDVVMEDSHSVEPSHVVVPGEQSSDSEDLADNDMQVLPDATPLGSSPKSPVTSSSSDGENHGLTGRSLLVRNLPSSTTVEDLSVFFADYTVLSSQVVDDSNGLGYVVLASADEARRAINSLNDQTLGDHVIELELERKQFSESDESSRRGSSAASAESMKLNIIDDQDSERPEPSLDQNNDTAMQHTPNENSERAPAPVVEVVEVETRSGGTTNAVVVNNGPVSLPPAADPIMLNFYYPGLVGGTCLLCVQPGHNAANCPSLTCKTCGLRGIHFTDACPQNQKCSKCLEKGHTKEVCQEKLNAVVSDPQICSRCNSEGHGADSCDLLWRSFKPDTVTATRVKRIPVFCYRCGFKDHFGLACGLRRTKPHVGGSTWTRENLNRYVDFNANAFAICEEDMPQEKEIVAPPSRDFSIKGRARNDPIELDDSDDAGEGFLENRIQKPRRPGKISINNLASQASRPPLPPGPPPPPPTHVRSAAQRFGDRSNRGPPAYNNYDEPTYREPHHDFDRNYRRQSYSPPPAIAIQAGYDYNARQNDMKYRSHGPVTSHEDYQRDNGYLRGIEHFHGQGVPPPRELTGGGRNTGGGRGGRGGGGGGGGGAGRGGKKRPDPRDDHSGPRNRKKRAGPKK